MALFTPGADTVDFNFLKPEQKLAIREGANFYDGLGGNDVVTLPNIANYNQSIGGGLTLNWANSAAQRFLNGLQTWKHIHDQPRRWSIFHQGWRGDGRHHG